ncbi:MAG: tetratricopeptide repeat protein [Tepidisphaeraceae bacterium]|jgi:Tfp pilus assembly protein PilF
MTVPANQQTLDLARREHQAGRIARAEILYRQILAENANQADAMGLLGLAMCQTNRAEEGVEWIGRAIAVSPKRADFHCNLGLGLAALGRIGEAVAAYRRAVEIHPNFAEGFFNLGNALSTAGEWEGAVDAFRRALAVRPIYPEAVCNLDRALAEMDRGLRVIEERRRDAAERPEDLKRRYRLAAALEEEGKWDEARSVYREAMESRPGDAMAHWRYGVALLGGGDYENGWREYEWRLRVEEFQRNRRELVEPWWDGGELSGRRIFLHPEQGLGDTIHFARYVKLVARRGGEVVLECPRELKRLFESLEGVAEIADWGGRLPRFDVQCAVPSLPLVMGLRGVEDVSWDGAYLKSTGESRGKFSDLILQGEGRLKVGLVWGGGAIPPGRSISLKMLAPLAHRGVQFFSLQFGKAAEEAKSPPAGMNLIDASGRIADLADSAGLMDQLDLIVSIDTAAAQLAGAMGKRVWVLLKRAADWRWLEDREDSPWYPTMRLFRQTRAGAWLAPIERMGEALAMLAT